MTYIKYLPPCKRPAEVHLERQEFLRVFLPRNLKRQVFKTFNSRWRIIFKDIPAYIFPTSTTENLLRQKILRNTNEYSENKHLVN